MSLYELLKFVHISAAVVWVGGSVALAVMSARVQKNADEQHMIGFARDAEFVGNRIFFPVSMLLLAAGIWMVLEGDWGFDHLWIIWGLAMYAFSAIIGGAVVGKAARNLGEDMAARGVNDEGVRTRVRKIQTWSGIELALLFVTIFMMSVKPDF